MPFTAVFSAPYRKLSLAGLFFCGLAALGLCSGAKPASAQSLISEMRIGVLAHDVPGLWSGFQLESDAPDINIEVVFAPYLPFLGGRIQPALGASINTGGDTSHAYIDARWQIDGPSGLFFALGLGAAIHDGETDPVSWEKKALGSRVLFHIPVEIGLHLDEHNSISAYFEHTSNAYTQTYNEGMDRIGVRYGYRF
ncbi:MAG: acyloxyacyl hydrolase [Hyphomicrobiaceae bacterium]|nr:acyloxyacyl hydrolase [Hyphomicrobiaceae bacterium]